MRALVVEVGSRKWERLQVEKWMAEFLLFSIIHGRTRGLEVSKIWLGLFMREPPFPIYHIISSWVESREKEGQLFCHLFYLHKYATSSSGKPIRSAKVQCIYMMEPHRFTRLFPVFIYNRVLLFRGELLYIRPVQYLSCAFSNRKYLNWQLSPLIFLIEFILTKV